MVNLLKSKLLLPGNPEEEFKVLEVAQQLKLQLKKLRINTPYFLIKC